MTEYRIALPSEREAYTELANYVFSHSHAPHDFEKLVPKVYGEGVDASRMHRVAVDEAGRLRALVAVLPGEAVVAGYELRTGFVGTVSVHPKARGEGHMKRLMDDWLEDLRGHCDILALGGQRQRYEYFGFTRGGTMYEYSVCPVNIRHALGAVDASALSFRPLFEAEGAEAFARSLNRTRPAYVRRDDRPLREILSNFTHRPLAIWDGEERIGYLTVNRDGNEISELAVPPGADIARIVKGYLAHSGAQGLTITAPEADTALNACLARFAEEYCQQPSGMYNILDFANVLRAYLSLKRQTVGLASGVFSAVLDGQPVTARVDGRGVFVERTAAPDAPHLGKQEAQLLLLTPHGRYLGTPSPEGWFPLPLFWYTADSF